MQQKYIFLTYGALMRDTRSDALDALRFLLAAWVVFVHVVPWTMAAGSEVSAYAVAVTQFAGRAFQSSGETNPAVLAFIVLSGYCIHRNGLAASFSSGDLARYARRRFFRIMPVYWLAVVAGIIGWHMCQSLNPAVDLSATASITSAGVFAKLSGVSVFWPGWHRVSFQGNAPLTTAMVEIYLYAAYPALLLAWHRPYAKAALGLFLAVSLGLAVSLPGGVDWWHNGSLAGFLVYWWVGAWFVSGRMSWRVLIALGVAWALVTLYLLLMPSGSFALVEARKVLLACLMGAGVRALDGVRVRVPPVLSLLGQGGYSLYALHAPLGAVFVLAGAPWYLTVIVCVGLGAAVFVCFERPLMRIGARSAQGRLAYPG